MNLVKIVILRLYVVIRIIKLLTIGIATIVKSKIKNKIKNKKEEKIISKLDLD